MVLKQKLLNIKLVIEYDGRKYFGWQTQKNKPTIQQTIENALRGLLKDDVKFIGAGRTDSGVHALNQVANFKLPILKWKNWTLKKLMNSLNAILPNDIAVKKINFVSQDFHSRFSAKSRVYEYYICESKRGFGYEKVFKVKEKINIGLAKKFCKIISGIHSFRQFCRNKDDKHNFNSDVKYAKVRRSNGLIKFEICANRFLHSMVRALVGAMLEVSTGKISIKEFQNKFIKGEKIKIQYVPANALVLKKINY